MKSPSLWILQDSLLYYLALVFVLLPSSFIENPKVAVTYEKVTQGRKVILYLYVQIF